MRNGGNHGTTTDSSKTEIKLPKAVMLAELQAALDKNGNKLDRKQYKLLSGLHDQH